MSFATLSRRPFQFREFIEQAWFIASLTILPTVLVAIPFAAVVALQTGSLIKQLGAESFTGAASVLAVIQQGSPIVTALLIAGAAGSAVTADLGSRTIREEIDAMRKLGIDPIHRLVVPRVSAMILVAVLLNGCLGCRHRRRLLLQRGSAGRNSRRISRVVLISGAVAGPMNAELIAAIFGVIACYKELNPNPGPKGVGEAVNQTVVITRRRARSVTRARRRSRQRRRRRTQTSTSRRRTTR